MAANPSTGKMVIPPHFFSYLEKHKIYELLYDMTTALAISLPRDHVLFLKNYLMEMGKCRYKSKIIILGPPHIDKESLANMVASALKLPAISLCDISQGNPTKLMKEPYELATKFKEYLLQRNEENHGWVLFDFPRNKQEAKAIQKAGLIPTHVFQLVPSPEKYTERDLWNEKLVNWEEDQLRETMREYKKRLIGLRSALKHFLREVVIRGRTMEQVAKALVILGRQFKNVGAPMVPRVVLIGPRGSYKQHVACLLSQRFGLIHVHMDDLIDQSKLRSNGLAEKIRELASRDMRIYGKFIVALLEDRLLDYDCLNNGWVLTGFPRDRNDLEALDLMDTPPNRVVFIETDQEECLQRLTNRRVNKQTGEVMPAAEVDKLPDKLLASQFVRHPKDDENTIIAEHQAFTENFQGMLDHCDNNCAVINGQGGPEAIYDRVCKVILSSSPAQAPRRPRTPEEIKKELTSGGGRTIEVKPTTVVNAPSVSFSENMDKETDTVQDLWDSLTCSTVFPREALLKSEDAKYCADPKSFSRITLLEYKKFDKETKKEKSSLKESSKASLNSSLKLSKEPSSSVSKRVTISDKTYDEKSRIVQEKNRAASNKLKKSVNE